MNSAVCVSQEGGAQPPLPPPPSPHGHNRMRQIEINVGIRDGAGRRMIRLRPSCLDDAGADVIAPQEHRLQSTGQRCGGLFQQVYSSASPQGTFGVALWFPRSRFNQFELATNAVSPRILSMCMSSATQCFRFVVAHSPHSGPAADQVAMDSFHTELLSVTSPQNP